MYGQPHHIRIIGAGQHRVLAQGWWADVEYRWDRATDDWSVMILDTNAYGRLSLFDMGWPRTM